MKKFNSVSLTYLLGIAGLIYLAALTGSATYKNYKTNQQIKKMKAETEILKLQNQNLKNLIAYYQTPSFKEKEARRKLGLVKPDEKMLILSKEPPQVKTPESTVSEETKKPNYRLWWEFFFKKG